MNKIAIIQPVPAVLDREATLDKAVVLINEVAANGAQLIVFPEASCPATPHGSGGFAPATTGG
ncbi:MAG: nitrilase-related carbon-nitrogen hydrolase [Sedimenticolaceae bacterium]